MQLINTPEMQLLLLLLFFYLYLQDFILSANQQLCFYLPLSGPFYHKTKTPPFLPLLL